ncbi:MAG: zinc finger domain-containing protein [Candidatus Nitrosocaldaceae archaeon]
MNSMLELPICASCKRVIMPNDESVKFNCPNCGRTLLWRCQSCREFARSYTCKSCNFSGP